MSREEERACIHDWQCYGVATKTYSHFDEETIQAVYSPSVNHYRACKKCGKVEELEGER